MRVGHQRGQDIDHGIDEAAVPGVLDLLDVLELIVDGFDDGTLAQQQLVGQGHEFVAHVLADCGDQLQAPIPQHLEELLGDVASIPHELAGQALSQLRDRAAIVDVARGDLEGQEFALVVDHQMELEAVEPAHGGFAAPGDLLEDVVTVDAAIVADHQRGRVDEGDPGVLAPAGVQVDAHRHQGGGDQCHKPAIAQQVGKLPPTVPAQMQQVKRLEVAVLGLMEIDQNRHDLAEGQPRGPPALARAVRQEWAMPGREEQPAEIINVAKKLF